MFWTFTSMFQLSKFGSFYQILARKFRWLFLIGSQGTTFYAINFMYKRLAIYFKAKLMRSTENYFQNVIKNATKLHKCIFAWNIFFCKFELFFFELNKWGSNFHINVIFINWTCNLKHKTKVELSYKNCSCMMYNVYYEEFFLLFCDKFNKMCR